MALRETGSILVHAPRERVFEALERRFLKTEAILDRVPSERLDLKRRTFVLQDAPHGATRVVLGKTAPVLSGRRDALREQVAQELLALQKLVE